VLADVLAQLGEQRQAPLDAMMGGAERSERLLEVVNRAA
jgi:hypothetical protein